MSLPAKNPYQNSLNGTFEPETDKGSRIVPIAELQEKMKDPRFREAMERINNYEGRPRQFQVVLHKSNNPNSDEKILLDNDARLQNLQAKKIKRLEEEKKMSNEELLRRADPNADKIISGRTGRIFASVG